VDNPNTSTTIRGQVSATGTGGCGPTFVGLFPDAVPHRAPIRFTMLAGPGPYVLADVPEGTWYLLAHAAEPAVGGDLAGSVGQLGPVTVRPGAALDPVDLYLRPMRTVDLPVLPAPFVTRPPDVARCGNVATHSKV
jgi:hypothetical protein